MSHKRSGPILCLGAALTAAVVALTAIGLSAAEPAAPRRELSAVNIDGNPVRVPLAGKPCLLVFLMADQPQSAKEAEMIAAAVGAHPGVHVVALVSGPQAEAAAKSLKGKLPGEIVVDKDYALAGKMSVRAWPTTLVIQSDGQELAHLAGLAKSFAKDLDSYLDFATGKIDRETLNRRQIIEDDPGQMAQRHLEIAERLLAKGFLPAARQELEHGLREDPTNVNLQLANVNLMITEGNPAQALERVDKIDAASLPPWKLDMARGRARGAEAVGCRRRRAREGPPAQSGTRGGLVCVGPDARGEGSVAAGRPGLPRGVREDVAGPRAEGRRARHAVEAVAARPTSRVRACRRRP